MSSYVILSSSKVAQLAYDCISRIESTREKKFEKLAQKELDRLTQYRQAQEKSWFHKIFGIKPIDLPTLEEIVERFKKGDLSRYDLVHYDGLSFEIHFIETYGRPTLKIARELIAAAKHSAEVYVSAEDLKVIQ